MRILKIKLITGEEIQYDSDHYKWVYEYGRVQIEEYMTGDKTIYPYNNIVLFKVVRG